jgi:VWFA-related protein
MMPHPHGLRTIYTLALAASLALSARAQTPTQQPQPSSQSGSYTLTTGTQLVVVDVVVEDQNGKPVHGLTRDNFIVTEDKKPQTITNFETRTADQTSKPGPALPKMPPGTFTNYTPVPAEGALNILLLDTLNTPMKDQSFVRYQLQQYVKNVDPHIRIAIFGLSTHLYLLQGFTSDPEVLKDAVEHKLLPRASNLLDDPVGSGATNPDLADSVPDASIAATVTQFEADTAAIQNQMRTQYTLDAFNDIAHYLSSFPGRKNLIWFSGSFPIDLLPDDTLNDPFAVMYLNDEEFQETTNLLGRAQVAVYPIDARGLMTNPAFSAANAGSKFATGNPAAITKAISNFNTSQINEHSTMDRMAEATGGRAFYNTNGLAQAVALALDSGANYYTLTYTPTDQRWDGNYRSIKVALAGQFANPNLHLKLTYRRGYYANDPNSKKKEPAAATVSTAEATAAHAAEAYRRNSISHGAPLPEDILFKIRAIPASATPENTLAPHNSPDPSKPIKAPFRRFAIDYAALPSDFKLTPTASGNYTGAIEFSAYLYSPEGFLLNAVGNTVELNLSPKDHEAFLKSAVGYHLEISAPVKGESYLRIIIHDVPSNHFGAIEVPVAAISNLPPVPMPTPRAAPSATPQH